MGFYEFLAMLEGKVRKGSFFWDSIWLKNSVPSDSYTYLIVRPEKLRPELKILNMIGYINIQ